MRDEEADEYHAPGANAVDEVALQRTNEAALDAGQGEGQSQLSPGPPEMTLEGNGPNGHGMKQRHGGDDHDQAGDEHQPPAIENALFALRASGRGGCGAEDSENAAVSPN